MKRICWQESVGGKLNGNQYGLCMDMSTEGGEEAKYEIYR